MAIIQAFGPSLDECVKVIGLLEIQIILAIIGIRGDKLTTNRSVNFAQHRFNMGLQILVRLIAAQFGNHGIEKAEAIAQFFRRSPHGRVNITRRQAMHRECMNQAQRHRLVVLARNTIFDARFQHLATVDDCADVRDRTESGILPQGMPVAVKGNQPWFIGWYMLVEDRFHADRKGFEHFALFRHRDAFKGINIVGMHREEANKFIHALIEVAIEAGKGH